MFKIILVTSVSFAISFFIQEYRYARRIKSTPAFPLPEIDQVKDAVIKIILSCRRTEQVLGCEVLILLFGQLFHNKVSPQHYNDCMDEMCTRLNRKYISLEESENMSEIDIDQKLNIA